MADPLSLSSAIIGLVPISYQAAKGLRDTIESFKKHPRQLRDLLDELKDLVNLLEELESILHSPGDVHLNLLEAPLKRCNSACKEFEQALNACKGRNDGGTKSDFGGWLKIQWKGTDINEFKNTLASYKSTIAIAIAGANLRTTKVSLNVIEEYRTIIEDTKVDLNEHLRNIDDKLHNPIQGLPLAEQSANESDIEAERHCTLQCLKICTQVSSFISERQRLLDGSVLDSAAEPSLGAEQGPSQRATDEMLRGCNSRVKFQQLHLSDRLEYLTTKLNSTSQEHANSPDRNQMAEEAETIRQCLEVCTQATETANNARLNVIEDVTSAEDSNQVLVSTVGELIAAHRITAGPRSNQTIGQMSDETVQHLSSVHARRIAEAPKSVSETPMSRDSSNLLGRTLGSSNVRTF